MTTERLSSLRWRRVAGLLASVLLLAVYARAPHAWGLGFVALVPWLLTLDTMRTTRATLLGSVLMSLGFVATVFGWFGLAIGAYTGVGAWPATAVMVLVAPLLQPQLLAFALVRHWVGRHHGPILRALAAASAWVATEALVPKLLGDTLGHGLYPSATLRQVGDLGGAAGISFLLLLVNEALAVAVVRRGSERASWRPLLSAAVIVAAMAGYGTNRLSALQAAPADEAPELRIAMIQASITDYERLRREMGTYAVVRHVLDTHYGLSVSAVRDHGADVLLWSETVYPTTFGSPRSADGAALDSEIQGFVDTMRVPLVFGTYDVDAAGEYNAATFLEPQRGRLGTYRKTHPFPVTEHVPAWMDGPLLRRLLPWAGTWQPGDGVRVLPLRSADGREVNVVPLICLDDVRTDLAIDGARLGAQAIVGMSNDSWFTARPVGARLHLAVAAFRSIETRLPQVRVTTNGLSAIIDDTGAVVAHAGIGQQAVLTASIAARTPPATLMVRWGDWVGRAGALFLLGLCTVAAWRALRRRQSRVDDASMPSYVLVLPPGWRILTAALCAASAMGLLWLAVDMARRVGWQVQSMSQLQWFAGVVVLPAMVSSIILHSFRARAGVEGGVLVLEQSRRRFEIPLSSIVALQSWRVPLPAHGVSLKLASGRYWARGVVVPRPQTLRTALISAGAPLQRQDAVSAALAECAQARGAARHRWMDNALLKFGLFPLVPALAAFRLHQVIAFGGPFGEYHAYGPKAWLLGLAIWWASWSLGLMLFAALLRILIEIPCTLLCTTKSRNAAGARDALEWVGRLVFYVGVPVWLALRLMASG